MNVLLVIMDSVRASNTSLHGYERDTTPYLESMAGESRIYLQARSPSRWSVPSHASIFTGLHTPEHGLDKIGKRLSGGETIWEWLRDRGYETGVFSRNSFLVLDDTGLDRGFDTVEALSDPPFDGANPRTADSIGEFLKEGYRHPIGSALNGVINKLVWDMPDLVPRFMRDLSPRLKSDRPYVDALLKWIAEREGSDWAACVNLMDAHGPRMPGELRWGTPEARRADREARTPWDYTEGVRPWSELRAVEDVYDDSLRDVDTSVERIVENLRSMDVLDDTMVIVTADHGEGFGEEDLLRESRLCGHIPGTHEALFHVPLIVRHPYEESEKIKTPVSLTEIPSVVKKGVTDCEFQFGDSPVWSFDIGTIPGRAVPKDLDLKNCDHYLSDATLRYDPGSDCDVRKTGYFDGQAVQFRIDGTDVVEHSLTSETPSEQFTDHGVSIKPESDGMDEEVEEHLEHLGYL